MDKQKEKYKLIDLDWYVRGEYLNLALGTKNYVFAKLKKQNKMLVPEIISNPKMFQFPNKFYYPKKLVSNIKLKTYDSDFTRKFNNIANFYLLSDSDFDDNIKCVSLANDAILALKQLVHSCEIMSKKSCDYDPDKLCCIVEEIKELTKGIKDGEKKTIVN